MSCGTVENKLTFFGCPALLLEAHHLEINSNQLTMIPEQCGVLTNLTKIDLSNNHLSTSQLGF